MKNIYSLILFLSLSSLSSYAQELEWMSWDEAVKRSQTDDNPKKIFIDIYTDWCGWCKKMDANTFQNPEVAKYMKDNFYMVKLDGEGKEAITFKNRTYKFVKQGRRGYHEFAVALMQGRLSYPTVIFMNEKKELLSPVPGYLPPDEFIKIARYFGNDHYLTTKWMEYDKNYLN